MRLLVLGAGGAVGRHAVTVAAQRGHEVIAAARTPPTGPTVPGVSSLAVDVRDPDAVRRALVGVDAVLWCIGVTPHSGPDVGRASLPGVLDGMAESGTTRLVAISGAGIILPGDRRGPDARALSAFTRRVVRDLVADRAGEQALLSASGADWTVVRPPRLVERAGVGTYLLGDAAPGLTARPVTKADVGLAMVDLAGGRDWLRRSPFLTTAPRRGGAGH